MGLRCGGLARTEGRRASLLHGTRVASNGRKIGGHGGSFTKTGGIMFPQKRRRRFPDLPRAAVTGAAGIREDLRGRLTGVQV